MKLTPVECIDYCTDCSSSYSKSSTKEKEFIEGWNRNHRSKMSLKKDGSLEIRINWFNLLIGRL